MANSQFGNYHGNNFSDDITRRDFQNQIDTSTPLNPLPKDAKDGIVNDGIVDNNAFSINLRNENIKFRGGFLHEPNAPSFVTPKLSDFQETYSNEGGYHTARSGISNEEPLLVENQTHVFASVPLTPKEGSDKVSTAAIFSNPWKPYVLLLYLHFATNLILLIVAAFLGYITISTIRADINTKIKLNISNTLSEISECSKEYYKNKCFNDENNKRAPALELTCSAWERCMNRDPQQLAKSKITAEALAEILNSFLAHLSWKSLFLLFSLLLGSFLISQATFGRLHTAWAGDQLSEVNQRLRALENELRESNAKKAAFLHGNNELALDIEHFPVGGRLLSMSTNIMPLSSPLADRYMRKNK